MHLSPEFGLTYHEIEADGFHIDRRVEMLLSSDTPQGMAKSIGLGVAGMADALQELQPDMVMLLGDRFEILAASLAALTARIPIVHIHGGETTEGAIDEAIRHAITKFSHLHFAAAEEYRRRIIQLGEHPDRVYCVGGLGVDNLQKQDFIEREALARELGVDWGKHNLLVTFHPPTLEKMAAHDQMKELLAALSELEETHLIFTMTNADLEGRILFEQVERFVRKHQHAWAFKSLGQKKYFSCMKLMDGVVGNSSSGILEAPTLRVGAVNIGSRQQGRLKASSVIDCSPERGAIQEAIQKLFAPAFQATLAEVVSPYGEGGACKKIIRIIEEMELRNLLNKKFHNLPGELSIGA